MTDPRERFQTEAVNAATKELRKADRAQVIMACGTGKTYVQPRIAAAMNAKIVVVLAPSLGLLDETYIRWAEIAKFDFDGLAVCSDKNVGKDAWTSSVSELHIAATTDPSVIESFLNHRTGRVQVIFSTYQSSDCLASALKRPIDLLIADEAHRAAGRENSVFATCTRDDFKANYRVFMTATPRFIRESNRIEVVSMDDHKRFGEVAYNLSFGKAVQHGLVCPVELIIGNINRASLAQVPQDVNIDRAVALAAMRIEIENHSRPMRLLTVHNTVRGAQEFAEECRAMFPGHYVGHVNGSMPINERRDVLSNLRDANDGAIVTHCNCLGEGVDVPARDGFVLVDPRKGITDIGQQTGRVMRPSPGKAVGKVIVPVLVPDDEEPTLESTRWKKVGRVVRAMMSLDTSLVDHIRVTDGSSGERSTGENLEIVAQGHLHESILAKIRTQVIKIGAMFQNVTEDEIVERGEDSHKRWGRLPTVKDHTAIGVDGSGPTWHAVNSREHARGRSLATIFMKRLPHLAHSRRKIGRKELLRCIKTYIRENGSAPSAISKTGAPLGSSWQSNDRHLRKEGSSLSKFVGENIGPSSAIHRTPFTEDEIWDSFQLYMGEIGKWPTGPLEYKQLFRGRSDGSNYGGAAKWLKKMGKTPSGLIRERLGTCRPRDLTEKQIKVEIERYFDSYGHYPSAASPEPIEMKEGRFMWCAINRCMELSSLGYKTSLSLFIQFHYNPTNRPGPKPGVRGARPQCELAIAS